eukprot:1758961-Prymnesium_polylepis.1
MEVWAVRGSATASRARDSSMLQCAVLWRESPRCASDGPLLAARCNLSRRSARMRHVWVGRDEESFWLKISAKFRS